MSKTRRVRFNPLEEEFPEEAADSVHHTEHAVVGMGKGPAQETGAPVVSRIEQLPPSKMIPDRFQPRRVLPASIRRSYFLGDSDCYMAADDWIKAASKDPGWQRQIDELLSMGDSFKTHGQIKPITGTWITSAGGRFVFQIETGERRFWAACLQRVIEKEPQEPLLRVEVIEFPSRHRQVLENRHAQTPSAVGQACEIAALLLEKRAVLPDERVEDEYEYFRGALNQRAPRGFWPSIEGTMRISTRRMQQLLAVLRLPSHLLEKADRYRLPERVLREVVSLPEKNWDKTIDLAINAGVTSEDVAQMKEHDYSGSAQKKSPKRKKRKLEHKAFSYLMKLMQASVSVESNLQLEQFLDALADEIIVQGMGDEISTLLGAIVRRVQTRTKRL